MASRSEIITQFWPAGLPTAAPNVILETSTEGQIGFHPTEVRRSKLLRFLLDGGLWSTVHIYWPAANEGRRALIYHCGHSSDWSLNWIVIGEAIARGYVVAEIKMPGYAYQPSYPQSLPITYTYPDLTTEELAGHNDFELVTTHGDPVLPCFLDPVFRTAQWMLANLELESLGLAGHSGGGWTALMAGALDTRFDFVGSIHGWCPLGATGEPTRDYEQIGPWYDSTSYEDYAAMIGARRQVVLTGSLDPVFGAANLGQSNIDAMTSAIQATGANFSQFTLTAPDHNTTAGEATKLMDEFDAINYPAYVAPRYDSTTANVAQMVAILNELGGYPKKGSGGSLVPQATWDGTPPTPEGWTAVYTLTDLGSGNARIDPSAQDYDRLFDAAQVATLSGADQTFVTTERINFVGR